jgi:hypothetical protein
MDVAAGHDRGTLALDRLEHRTAPEMPPAHLMQVPLRG